MAAGSADAINSFEFKVSFDNFGQSKWMFLDHDQLAWNAEEVR